MKKKQTVLRVVGSDSSMQCLFYALDKRFSSSTFTKQYHENSIRIMVEEAHTSMKYLASLLESGQINKEQHKVACTFLRNQIRHIEARYNVIYFQV